MADLGNYESDDVDMSNRKGLQLHLEGQSLPDRWISCPNEKCGGCMNAKHMQLRTKAGARKLWCNTCKSQIYATTWTCSCGIIWSQCDIHSTDPDSHCAPVRRKSRRADAVARQGAMHLFSALAPLSLIRAGRSSSTRKRARLEKVQSEHPGFQASQEIEISTVACPKLARKVLAWRALSGRGAASGVPDGDRCTTGRGSEPAANPAVIR